MTGENYFLALENYFGTLDNYFQAGKNNLIEKISYFSNKVNPKQVDNITLKDLKKKNSYSDVYKVSKLLEQIGTILNNISNIKNSSNISDIIKNRTYISNYLKFFVNCISYNNENLKNSNKQNYYKFSLGDNTCYTNGFNNIIETKSGFLNSNLSGLLKYSLIKSLKIGLEKNSAKFNANNNLITNINFQQSIEKLKFCKSQNKNNNHNIDFVIDTIQKILNKEEVNEDDYNKLGDCMVKVMLKNTTEFIEMINISQIFDINILLDMQSVIKAAMIPMIEQNDVVFNQLLGKSGNKKSEILIEKIHKVSKDEMEHRFIINTECENNESSEKLVKIKQSNSLNSLNEKFDNLFYNAAKSISELIISGDIDYSSVNVKYEIAIESSFLRKIIDNEKNKLKIIKKVANFYKSPVESISVSVDNTLPLFISKNTISNNLDKVIMLHKDYRKILNKIVNQENINVKKICSSKNESIYKIDNETYKILVSEIGVYKRKKIIKGLKQIINIKKQNKINSYLNNNNKPKYEYKY